MRHFTKTWICLAALSLLAPGTLAADEMDMLGSPAAFSNGATGFADDASSGHSVGMRVSDWKNYGGGRTYWRSVTAPRQMRMGGMAFVDPASVPLLVPDKQRMRRRPARKQSATAGGTGAQSTAPAGAASARLQLPKNPAQPEAAPAPAKPAPEAAPPAPGADAGLEAGSAPVAQAAPARRRRSSGPKVTTEVWEPTPPVTSAVTPPLPFLKGN